MFIVFIAIIDACIINLYSITYNMQGNDTVNNNIL